VTGFPSRPVQQTDIRRLQMLNLMNAMLGVHGIEFICAEKELMEASDFQSAKVERLTSISTSEDCALRWPLLFMNCMFNVHKEGQALDTEDRRSQFSHHNPLHNFD
jgi:hypothetical protein